MHAVGGEKEWSGAIRKLNFSRETSTSDKNHKKTKMVKRTIFFVSKFKKCPMITENSWKWMPTHETALRIKQFQNKTHSQTEFRELRNGLSAWALGLTRGSTFPCCSQYCISSLTHIESFTLWTVSSRRSCSTKMRCGCKSLLLFPDGITADTSLNCISL